MSSAAVTIMLLNTFPSEYTKPFITPSDIPLILVTLIVGCIGLAIYYQQLKRLMREGNRKC